MLKTNLMRFTKGPLLGIEGEPFYPEYAIRWVGEDFAAIIRLKAETTIFDIDLQLQDPFLDVPSIHSEEHCVNYDIDYYSTKLVGITQLNIAEWVKQVLHAVRRDSSAIFRGFQS